MNRIAAFLVVTLAIIVPAHAAAETRDTAASASVDAIGPVFATPPASAVVVKDAGPLGRPSILPALYGGSVALQAFDVYSTLGSLRAGAREANPVMQGATSNVAVFVALKASVTATTIMAAEKMWRNHHRVTAVAMMVASNGIMAAVAAHNASVLSSLR